MNPPAKTIAILTAKPGLEGELQALLSSLAESSRQEPGNLGYDVWRDRDDPRRFVLDEVYQDDEAVSEHRATAHFQDYLARIGGLADRLAVVAHPIDVV